MMGEYLALRFEKTFLLNESFGNAATSSLNVVFSYTCYTEINTERR